MPLGPTPPWPLVCGSEIATVREESNDLTLRALVTGAEHGADLSVSWVSIDGQHRRLLTRRSTRVYLVESGTINLQIEDGPVHTAQAGDLVVIPRASAYELAGTATYFVLNAPAFVDGDDEYVAPADGTCSTMRCHDDRRSS